jgi:signal transduction histidine kinase
VGAAGYIDATSRGVPPELGLSFLAGYSWAYLVAGAIAWDARPDSRIGPLMTAVGVTGSMLLFAGSAVPGLNLLPLVGVPLMNLFLIWLVLSYPSGRLSSRLEVATVGAAGLAVGVVYFLFSVIGPEAMNFGAWVLLTISTFLLGLIVHHGVKASTTARAGLAPMLVAGVLVVLLFSGESVAWLVGITTEVGSPYQWFCLAAHVTVPVAVLVGLLRQRFARAAVADFLVDLGDNPGPAELQEMVVRALRDPSATLAYWLPEYDSYADVEGRQVNPDPVPGRAATTIVSDGVPVALILHDDALDEEQKLLASVTAAIGMTIQNAQLQVELKARLEEIRGSRVRILQAEQSERRRLERDLHDGAQQRLIALTLELGELGDRLNGDVELRTRIDAARQEVTVSLAELRDLAHGIHPAAVSDHGLAVALESVATRATVPVEVIGATQDRMPEPVELAAFFIVSEALTNVARHAGASSALVELERNPGALIVEVRDDGIGGASADNGSGLRGLADRVEALGGRLQVWSPQGRGTRLRAEIPCG